MTDGLDLSTLSRRRRWAGTIGRGVLAGAAGSSFLILGGLIFLMLREGLTSIDWHFLTSYTSSRPERAGIKASIVGTLWVGFASMVVALPLGIMAAVYLNEFARANRLTSLLRASISNIAGVPSVVFGILGLALFVRFFDLGASIIAAGLTLGLLTLPIVIVVSEESLKSVPRSIREGAFALPKLC